MASLEGVIEGTLTAAIVGLAIVAFPGWVAYQEIRHGIMHLKGADHHYCGDVGEYEECSKKECTCY